MNQAADEYDEAKPDLGDEFLSDVERSMKLIINGPHRWPPVGPRHHRVILHRFPYSIIYRFNETEVIVVAIAHNRRRPGYWAARR
jgi:hypothetical protein